ncbi:hypothetical protein [Segetibacter aerophilus]|uniref:Uncharacterized protein n=1 Tax=Segetibacter aerophilus TaxID=670293 RepID=A0A512B8N2_9BACT|nr:hypothetical protein [Segetibacter aerophilus]GEO08318.1 hypothetical protein SAE01_08140 [Segetibacter aerophilus]
MTIPITFEFNGKIYVGELSHVSGSGNSTMFHLYINRFYYGRLRYSVFADGWVFDTNAGSVGWEVLAEHFGYHVIAWYHCL